MKQNLTELKGENRQLKTVFGDLNIPLSVTDVITKGKISKDTQA